MRWPFGPPHLTLEPSKKIKKNKKQTNKQTKKKKGEENKNTKRRALQLSINFFFFGGCPKCPFLTTWPKKRPTTKHYKSWVFSKAFFEKQMCVTKRLFLDKKQNLKVQLSFLLPILFSFNKRKIQKLAETPILKCFCKPKKEIFPKLNLK